MVTPQVAGVTMLIGGIIPAYIVYWLRTEPQGIIVRWFRFAMVCGMVWSISFGLIVLVESSVLRLAITNVFIIAVPAASIAMFALCYEFTFREPIPKPYLLLFVPLVVLFALSWINPAELIYTVDNPYQTSQILIPATPGSVRLPINMIGAPVLILMSAGLVAGELLRTDHKPRRIQAVLLLLMIIVGFVPAMMKVLELVPAYFDPSPIGWSLKGLIFAATIKRFDSFRVSPSSKDRVFETLSDPVIILNPEDVVSNLNKAARNVFDVELGMTVADFEIANPELESRFTSEETTIEINTTTDRRVFDYSELAVQQGYGLESRILWFQDITEQSTKADALKAKNKRLDAFASRISHDLQAPITVAGSYVNLAQQDTEQSDALDEVETALERTENLIEDILAMARGGHNPECEPVALRTLAQRAWCSGSTGAASLEIEAVATVSADQGQLLRVFENMFQNAIDHGGCDVTVRVGTTEDGFYVADDGVGISAQDRESIFNDGMTYESDGTGYGLAIVKNIIDGHGWSIDASSSESGGARFDIRNVTLDTTSRSIPDNETERVAA